MQQTYNYVFPAICGIQAKREYYISMCPLKLIPKIFIFNEDELAPELRAQRILNKNRLPEISQYIINNPDNYIFSALTASVDTEVHFMPSNKDTHGKRMGLLHIPMDARFVINDGQHRRAAIETALKENPALGDETIGIVLFLDKGLKRSQQMFADLNRYAIRPATSLNVLYDYRDEKALLAKSVVFKTPIFRDVVEMERSTLSARSRKLFTLSAIYTATKVLIAQWEDVSSSQSIERAIAFWDEVSKQFPDWKLVKDKKLNAGEIRRDYIHSHGVVLEAIGCVGNQLLHEYPTKWKQKLKGLKKLDWCRSNAKLWEGRSMIGGKVSKSRYNVILTANVIKKQLGLTLTPDAQQVEDAFLRGEYEKS